MEQSTAALDAKIGQLTRELDETRAERDEARAERDEARRQQTATADVLKVINRSQVDLQAVFETLVDLAARLCRAERATILRLNGDCFTLAASYGMPADFREYLQANPFRLDRGSLSGRAALECRPVHVPDVLADPDFTQHETQKLGGFRSALAAPLMRDGSPIGSIFLTRAAVDPFTQQEIELIITFADQAVIAIENARLFEEVQSRTRELQQSLEYQTATSDVLKVISRSAFDLHTVLDTLNKSAARLCGADTAIIRQREGDTYPLAATYGLTGPQRDHFAAYSSSPDRGSVFGRAILEGRTIHVPDVLGDPEYNRPRLQDFIQVRAALGVPLMRDGVPVGVFTLQRREPRAYSQKEIELVTTFADQAMIAIENVGSSKRCRRARASCRSRLNTKRRLVTFSASSAARHRRSSLFSTRLQKPPAGFARRMMC